MNNMSIKETKEVKKQLNKEDIIEVVPKRNWEGFPNLNENEKNNLKAKLKTLCCVIGIILFIIMIMLPDNTAETILCYMISVILTLILVSVFVYLIKILYKAFGGK